MFDDLLKSYIVKVFSHNLKDMENISTEYDFNKIEKYWQNFWDADKTFKASIDSSRPKYYILDMFPYPSGAGLHIGHPEGYTASDIVARFKRAKGYNVLHPMGWDAFGLPAEQYALKTGTHPAITTHKNIENFRRQIKEIGFAIDWDREINTTDPKYFKWTQWIFLRLFEMGLAYVDEKPVWWCPALGTVLANEEVIDGKSEVGKHPVERRKLRQWVLKITAYADKLLAGLKTLDWPDSTKRLQENWIGRSEGAQVDFNIKGLDENLRVFTTRPDTLYGVTFMVIAPEHPLVAKLTTPENKAAVDAYVKSISSKSDLDRTDLAKDKSGVFTGSYAINPVTKREVPIWIADYVLMSYGTGAIMAVPAHDDRDYDFAVKYNLPVIRVIDKKDENGNDIALPFTDVGTMVNSEEFNGTKSLEGKAKITQMLKDAGKGEMSVNYKLRDWLFSRQRYWGEPFPIMWVSEEAYNLAKQNNYEGLPKNPVVYKGEDGVAHYALPVLKSSLPLTLPEIKTYAPSGTGESPLAHASDWLNIWVNVKTGETLAQSQTKPEGEFWFKALRETNTMPQWAGSCWYYLRYCDPTCDTAPISKEAENYWGTPDFYIGGAEHAVLHLLYARFWHKVLFDCGVVKEPEPFKKLFHQGIILGQLEYTAYKDKDGNFVSQNALKGDEEGVKVDEADVVKIGTNYALKSDNKILVDARCYKMSKSRGNVVNPDDIVKNYGADALRLYEMFLGPLEDQKPWNTSGIEGVSRFLKKVWREFVDRSGAINAKISDSANESREYLKVLNETIKKVDADIENLRFNTAISQMMICLSAMQKEEKISTQSAKSFLKLLAPFAPHICEEIWSKFGEKGSISKSHFPVCDDSLLTSDTVKMAVQVNGKLRAEISVSKTAQKDEVLTLAKSLDSVKKFTDGKQIVKEIFVPAKIVNIVVK